MHCTCLANTKLRPEVFKTSEINTYLRSHVVVHGVDDIVQKVDVQLLTEVQQLSCCVIRQHGHVCRHRAAGDQGTRRATSFRQQTSSDNSLTPHPIIKLISVNEIFFFLQFQLHLTEIGQLIEIKYYFISVSCQCHVAHFRV